MIDFSESSHIYNRALDPNGQDSLAKIVRLVRPASEVLDLGAGPGILGRYLSENLACTVDGVEYNPLAVELAARYYRHLEVANLEQISLCSLFPEAQYDYIICADILEHLRDPGRLVEQLADLLKPEGRVLISIPNVAYAGLIAGLLADEFRYRPEGLLDQTHLRFFTRSSLLAFLTERGFVVCSQDSVVMEPRQSEFTARYLDAFPPALVRGLLARPDAFTYQFIIEAKAGKNGESQEPPKALATPELRFACQLFWRSEHGGYLERNSSFAFGCLGKDKQMLSLPIPSSPERITALRLDLADRPGLLRIFGISLHDSEGQCCWAWDGRGSSLDSASSQQVVIADLLPGESGVTALLTGVDPTVELPIPKEALMGLEKGGDLRVQLTWPMSMDSLALVQHCVPRKDLQTIQTALAAVEAGSAELETQNALLRSHNAELAAREAALALRSAELESWSAELDNQVNLLEASLAERIQYAVIQAEELESLRRALADIQASTIWRWSTPYRQAMTWLHGRRGNR